VGVAVEGFTESPFTALGRTYPVYRRGSGPAVIVIHEVPGLTPLVAQFGREVADAGLTAVLPSLFGEPGRPMTAGYAAKSFFGACVSKEFHALALGQTSPIIDWLRELARHEHSVCGGPGVGAVGMCFTGGFALAMAVDDRMVAPVLSQPSLPFALSARHKASIDCSPADLAVVKRRCETDGLEVLGLRFRGDKLSPGERFDFLRRELGDAFVAVELPDESAAGSPPHSVLTEHLIDEPGQPTRAALDQVLDLFRTKLLLSTP
jgi:dienelactone hydrolase